MPNWLQYINRKYQKRGWIEVNSVLCDSDHTWTNLISEKWEEKFFQKCIVSSSRLFKWSLALVLRVRVQYFPKIKKCKKTEKKRGEGERKTDGAGAPLGPDISTSSPFYLHPVLSSHLKVDPRCQAICHNFSECLPKSVSQWISVTFSQKAGQKLWKCSDERKSSL